MRRADLVALPYRNIEQSGVLYTALAFGRPLVLSDVGGFPEIAELGAARLVPPRRTPRRSPRPCASCSATRPSGSGSAAGAAAAAEGHYSWDEIGRAPSRSTSGCSAR